MKKIIYLIMFSLLVIGCEKDKTVEKYTVSKVEFAQHLSDSDVQIVDCRTPAEFQQGAIPKAVNIDYQDSDFKNLINQRLDKSKDVLIYCRSGKRSAKATKILVESGFTAVYNLDGGYLNWSKK